MLSRAASRKAGFFNLYQMNEIEKYQGFKAELAIAETFEELKFIESKAAAAAEFARKNKIGLDEQNQWGRFRVEIESKKGLWLDEKFPRGGEHGNQFKEAKLPLVTLANEGISKKESVQARNIFRNPEPVKAAIERIESSGKVVTPALVNTELKKENIIRERDELAEKGKLKKLDIDFRFGDFNKVFSDVANESIDCIITDPPYPYEFINCWSELSLFAKRVLKPNGFCIAYSGQMHLPEVLKRMCENLDYYWTFAVYHEGQTQIINGVNLICRWKPVLIFQNGKKKLSNTFQDYFISEHREKTGHDWQQSKSGVSYLIEMFTNEGDLICDPFAGSGTIIKASIEKKRNIIASEINEQTYNIAKALF